MNYYHAKYDIDRMVDLAEYHARQDTRSVILWDNMLRALYELREFVNSRLEQLDAPSTPTGEQQLKKRSFKGVF
jgi:hypothetical protein